MLMKGPVINECIILLHIDEKNALSETFPLNVLRIAAIYMYV